MDSPQTAKAELLKAIAHPNRIRILEALRKEEVCNCELVPALGLEQSNLSRHLSVLIRAGILTPRKVGVKTYYQVVAPEVYDILDLARQIILRRAKAHLATMG